VASLAAAALAWAGIAQAGYALQPASGTTITSKPTFVVHIDPADSFPMVFVATSTAMNANFVPTDEAGSCTPSTPTGEAHTFSCQPTFYSPSLEQTLRPGVYVWWLTFWRTDPGAVSATPHISGPLQVTVPQPPAPSGVSLLSPADGARVTSSSPVLLVRAPANATVTFHVSDKSGRAPDGSSPYGAEYADCMDVTSFDGTFSCDINGSELSEGTTFYWWIVVTVDGASFAYNTRSFSYQPASSGGGGGGNGGGGW
jgi:hypothetical protein